jgi:Cu(I)/Ag(I) efflux system membrane fusion protein
MSLVQGDMHNHWMTILKQLNQAIDGIQSTDLIKKQRLAYSDFNDALYSAIKMFGTSGETIYYQFCPMAKDGDGAYWLSSKVDIKNPYYGDAMLECGENKEILK